MAKQSFWDHPIDKLEEALNLKKQIHALQAKLSSMFGSDDDEVSEPKKRPGFAAPAAAKTKPAKAGKRTMSPEARERIAAAQRARWAKSKGTSSSSAASVSSTKPAKKGKRTMSPETKAKMAAAMKARWAAAKRKGLPGPNARK